MKGNFNFSWESWISVGRSGKTMLCWLELCLPCLPPYQHRVERSLVCVEGRERISRSGLTQYIKIDICVFQCDVPHQWIVQRHVGPCLYTCCYVIKQNVFFYFNNHGFLKVSPYFLLGREVDLMYSFNERDENTIPSLFTKINIKILTKSHARIISIENIPFHENSV